jgi:PIN domain nuclease of toxin-antitoxin system
MIVLLDTNAWLWMTFSSKRLGRKTKSLLADPEKRLALSVASIWEIVIKSALGKLAIPGDARAFLRETLATQRIVPLDITIDHVLEVARLPDIHRDPFDRVIVAQCIVEKMQLVSGDARLAAYPIDLLDAGR